MLPGMVGVGVPRKAISAKVRRAEKVAVAAFAGDGVLVTIAGMIIFQLSGKGVGVPNSLASAVAASPTATAVNLFFGTGLLVTKM